MKLLVAACFFFGFPADLVAEVLSLSWDTACPAPIQTLHGNAQPWLPAFRLGLSILPESDIVALALSQPSILGITKSQAASIAPLIAKRYESIAASPEFSRIPSQLPYCYSVVRPVRGAGLARIPAEASPQSPVILFLHGYGGSFLWSLHWLSEALPQHIVVAPAYGISPADPPAEYLKEALAAASRRLGFGLAKPSLAGLSAGGFGACRAFHKDPDAFDRLICLAAYPPDDTLRRFRRTQSIHFIAGGQEPFVVSGHFGKVLRIVRSSCPAAEMALVPGADHFFMLTHPAETARAVRAALTATAGGASAGKGKPP
jgi:pimeloyl-ACP methyl ester carboxylesterase